MTGYLDWYVIVNVAYNIPICQSDFIPTMSCSRSDICSVIAEIESAIVFDSFWV